MFALQGLSLSGGDEADSSSRITNGLTTQYSGLSENVHVVGDTHGSIATATSVGEQTLHFFSLLNIDFLHC